MVTRGDRLLATLVIVAAATFLAAVIWLLFGGW
jgi:hypothetical protein